MKTILFVLALAAAPALSAQVAQPVMPAGQALIAATPVTAVRDGQNVYVAVYTDFGQVVARIDAQRAITQGSRLFPYGLGDIWPGSVSLALGRVFYRIASQFRSGNGTSHDDVAIAGAGPIGGPVLEAHGWAYFASETGGQVSIQRTDGFVVDSFLTSLPGQLADMRVVNDRLIVATRAPALTIHSIDAPGGVALLCSGTVPQSGRLMDVIEDGLVFSDRDASGLWRLMITDGTPPGAHVVPAVYMFGEPRDCLVHNGFVYFMMPGAAGFREAWRTDGTWHGTQRLTTWDVEGVVSGKAVVHESAVYFMTTWASRNSLWQVGPEYPGALCVYQSEPQPYYAAPEFVAGGRIYLRDTQGRLWRGEPTPTSFQLAAIGFAGVADRTLGSVLAVFGNMAVVTDQQNQLWTIDFSGPPSEAIDETGCVAGAMHQWPAPMLAGLLAACLRRRAGRPSHKSRPQG